MHNSFLKYLLNNDPNKTVSNHGIKMRKVVSPLLRRIIPYTVSVDFKILHRAELPKDESFIFTGTHGFREDVEGTVLTAGRHAYILIGSLKQVFKSREGITAWLNGAVLVDRQDSESRSASKEKMKRVLQLGGNIIMFPEGTWNISPNKLVGGIFPGVYDVAAEAGVRVVPIATHRVGSTVYTIGGNALDIASFERKKGLAVLRDKMASLKWYLMEKFPVEKRSDLPIGKKAMEYWKRYTDALKAEVRHFEHELEDASVYRHKDIIHKDEAFSFMKKLLPGHKNAFLFNKKLL